MDENLFAENSSMNWRKKTTWMYNFPEKSEKKNRGDIWGYVEPGKVFWNMVDISTSLWWKWERMDVCWINPYNHNNAAFNILANILKVYLNLNTYY